MDMDKELEELRKKRLEEIKKKISYKVGQEEKKEGEGEQIYDFVIPGGVHIDMVEKAAKISGVELVDRSFDVPDSFPGIKPTGFVAKTFLVARGTKKQIEDFKALIRKELLYYVDKYEKRLDQRLKKHSWWWKHYHVRDFDDVRRDKHYNPEKDFKKWEDAMREWRERAKKMEEEGYEL
ncbi:MAG: hypothetical protein ACXQTS_02640 [Candidatus Methanospirareceae archaeon]